MDPPHASKKPRLDRSADLLNIPNKMNKATPSVLIVNKKSPSIFRVGESKFVAGVKKFLDSVATQQDQSTDHDDLNIEVVSEGEAYIEMTLGLVPLEEEDTDELSDRSDSESSETSCEDLKLPDGRYVQNTENINAKLLIEEIENK